MKYPPGTYQNPFAANSRWNSQVVGAILGPRGQVKRTQWGYFPAIEAGAYSTGVFLAKVSDPSVTVMPLGGQPGVQIGDCETFVESVKIQNWPADVVLPGGSDGHCDIIDPASGRIHSFWMLQRGADNVWRAQLYNWSPLGGLGWGDPAHYIHGARAAAVPPAGGLIRKHEVNDGDTLFRHALAMSLPLEGLSAYPAYVAPATNRDWDYYNNTGTIPYGTLLMLPKDYQLQPVNRNNPVLMRLVETLKTYGAYAVDRNVGTPFAIYAELNCGLNLSMANPPVPWDGAVMGELDIMVDYLAPVISCEGYLDGNGKLLKSLPTDFNLISMRGGWSNGAIYDTWKQAVVLPPVTTPTEFVNAGQRAIRTVEWAEPNFYDSYIVTAKTQGGATVKVEVTDGGGDFVFMATPDLKDKESAVVSLQQFCFPRMTAKRGAGTTKLTASLTMKRDRRKVPRRIAERRK